MLCFINEWLHCRSLPNPWRFAFPRAAARAARAARGRVRGHGGYQWRRSRCGKSRALSLKLPSKNFISLVGARPVWDKRWKTLACMAEMIGAAHALSVREERLLNQWCKFTSRCVTFVNLGVFYVDLVCPTRVYLGLSCLPHRAVGDLSPLRRGSFGRTGHAPDGAATPRFIKKEANLQRPCLDKYVLFCAWLLVGEGTWGLYKRVLNHNGSHSFVERHLWFCRVSIH